MLKKGVGVKWTVGAKKSFESVKLALTQALVLINPDFSKDFLIFSFASEHTLAAEKSRGNGKAHFFLQQSTERCTLEIQHNGKISLCLSEGLKRL